MKNQWPDNVKPDPTAFDRGWDLGIELNCYSEEEYDYDWKVLNESTCGSDAYRENQKAYAAGIYAGNLYKHSKGE